MHGKLHLDGVHHHEVETLKARLASCVSDEILNTNLAISMQYYLFLLALDDRYSLPGPVVNSVYKDVILHIASVVEGMLLYALKELRKRGSLPDACLEREEIFSDVKEVYRIADAHAVVAGIRKRRPIPLKDDANFIVLNRIAKRSGLFDEGIFGDAESLRRTRNRIHLASLQEKDGAYVRKDVEKAFSIMESVLTRVEVAMEA